MKKWTDNQCSTWEAIQRWSGRHAAVAPFGPVADPSSSLDRARILSYIVAGSTIVIMLLGILAALFTAFPGPLPRVI